MASYPTSVKTFTSLTDGIDDVLASHQNEPNDEITAIETELGVNPKTITDATAPSASPASVAEYLDMVATIVKTISGSTTWTNAAAAAIMKSIGTTKGDLIAFSGSATPIRFAGSTTDGEVLTRGSTETAGMKWAALPTIVGAYGTRGLTGTNNSGTPNTIFDFSANLVVLRNPTSGAIAVQSSTSTFSNNVGTAGSTANGRDQAGAFSASSWIHFYFIWDGTTLATLSSATAPPTGPTLPTGYTHWSYLGAVRFNGSSQLVVTRITGNRASYTAGYPNLVPLSGGSAQGANPTTSIDLTAYIPPNALTFIMELICSYADTSANQLQAARIGYVSGSAYFGAEIVTQVANIALNVNTSVEMPVVAQTMYYNWVVNAGTRAMTIYATGYTIPNNS